MSIPLRFSAALLTLSLSASPQILLAENPSTSKVSIFNFGQIAPGYYRGGEPDAREVVALAKLGVRTVIDLQKDGDSSEPLLVEKAGMKFVRIPMTTRIPPTAEQLTQFLGLVSDPAHQPVYVHCREGRHRTGVMTAVYRMVRDGWTADRAFREMKDCRFGADFLHPEFKRFVMSFKATAFAAPAPLVQLAAATN
jgi:protein tyrosine/serine phosphatase